MASVTEEIKRERRESRWIEQPEDESLNAEPSQAEPSWTESSRAMIADKPGTHWEQSSQKEVTRGEWDNGTGSAGHKGRAELTGKLCWCMMALIWWKVGADKAVTEHVVRALVEWLHRQGISIYTDLL
jgi:hypothetical protein